MRAHTQGTSRVLLIMGFAVLAAVMLMLGGCELPNDNIVKGQALCANNGGAQRFYRGPGYFEVVCGNGARFNVYNFN